MSSSNSDSSIQLIGVAHASEQGHERVKTMIHESDPDCVAVELDHQRFHRLWNDVDRDWKSLLTSNLGVRAKLVSLLLAFNQRKVMKKFDMSAGEADMLPAVRSARDLGADVKLIDMSSKEMLSDLSDSVMSIAAVKRLLKRVLDSDERDTIDATLTELEDFIEEHDLDTDDTKSQVASMEEMPLDDLSRFGELLSQLFPNQYEAVVSQRNEYMAGRLHWLRTQGHDVAAVVGRLHVPGMQELLDEPERIPSKHVVKPDSVEFI